MEKKRFTEEQIAFALRQAESGTLPALRILATPHFSGLDSCCWSGNSRASLTDSGCSSQE